MNKTKKLSSKQKQVIKLIPMADIHANLNSDEKMKHLDIINSIFTKYKNMFQVKTNSIPETLKPRNP